MLWDKGIKFVAAAQLLKENYFGKVFQLCGMVDLDNKKVPESYLKIEMKVI
jgi:hypothetical protein